MPAAELVALVNGLDEQWGWHEENTARLLEVHAYQLEWGWADRTIDPDDPDVKAERRKARNRKPPPHPIVPPVALRPRKWAEQREQLYIDELTKYAPKQTVPQDPLDMLALWDQQHGFA